mgnify:CR=1 FL=1
MTVNEPHIKLVCNVITSLKSINRLGEIPNAVPVMCIACAARLLGKAIP